MSQSPTPLILICLTFFGVFSCVKDPKGTTINGTVIDKKSNLPIEAAILEFVITHYSGDGHTEYEHNIIQSDQNGKFLFTEPDGLDFYLLSVGKAHYLLKFSVPLDFQKNKSNDVVIPMTPVDGFFRLSLSNIPGGQDSIFVAIYSPAVHSEAPISKGIVINKNYSVPISQSKAIDLPMASEENVEVYWGFQPLPALLANAPFHESVFVVLSDTTNYNIAF